MDNAPTGLDHHRSATTAAVVSSLIAVLSLVAVLLGSATAGAAPKASAVGALATCPTDYTGNTVPNCTTTTTAASSTTAGYTLVLEITYLHAGQTSVTISGGTPANPKAPPAGTGALDWQECGFPSSATGLAVQLEINGVLITAGGGIGTVGSDGCVPDPQIPVCLEPGTYNAAGNTSGYPTAAATFVVSGTPTCANPVGPTTLVGINTATAGGSSGGGSGSGSASPSSSSASPGGALAFTGSNVLRLLVIALAVIVVGSVIARSARRRKHGL